MKTAKEMKEITNKAIDEIAKAERAEADELLELTIIPFIEETANRGKSAVKLRTDRMQGRIWELNQEALEKLGYTVENIYPYAMIRW